MAHIEDLDEDLDDNPFDGDDLEDVFVPQRPGQLRGYLQPS